MAWQPDYATKEELKSFVHIDDSVDDSEVALAVTTASRAVDLSTNRQFGQLESSQARLYPAEWDRWRCRWIIDIDDLMVEDGLTVNADRNGDDTFDDAIDEFRLEPVNAESESRPWTRLMVKRGSAVMPSAEPNALIEVTAQFGWLSVPTSIQEATLLQASRLLARRNAPFGVAGSPDLGSEMRLLARLDPDVEVSVSPFRRWWGAV